MLSLERLFLLKLALWGALSAVAGTALLALAARKPERTLVRSLATTLLVLGVLEALSALIGRGGIGLRTLASATALDRALWLGAGFALAWGFVAIFVAIWSGARVAGGERLTGAAIGAALHAWAVAVLALQLATSIVR